jgi:hypothetical protein
MNKGITLIFLEQQQKGNDILKQLYNRQQETPFKELLASYLNRFQTRNHRYMDESKNYRS